MLRSPLAVPVAVTARVFGALMLTALVLSAFALSAFVLSACRTPGVPPAEEVPEPLETTVIPPQPEITIQNPYAGVDWGNHHQHRANLHTHTRNSDGLHGVARVIDLYREAGYTILAISDHNHVTWPWTKYDRDPVALEMAAIPANEISDTHHIGSYFSEYNINGRRYRPIIGRMGLPPTAVTEREVFEAIGRAGGLAVFFHPGRYDYPVEWYLDYYERFPHLIGLEVVNRADRYPQDRELWDAILRSTMPDRPVWGFANDDFHRRGHLGHAYNVFPLAKLSAEAVREAMERGAFYFSNGREAPVIDAVNHDPEAGTVTVSGSGYHTLTWISEGHHIARGGTLSYHEQANIGSYLRAELHGSGGITYTNPFAVTGAAEH